MPDPTKLLNNDNTSVNNSGIIPENYLNDIINQDLLIQKNNKLASEWATNHPNNVVQRPINNDKIDYLNTDIRSSNYVGNPNWSFAAPNMTGKQRADAETYYSDIIGGELLGLGIEKLISNTYNAYKSGKKLSKSINKAENLTPSNGRSVTLESLQKIKEKRDSSKDIYESIKTKDLSKYTPEEIDMIDSYTGSSNTFTGPLSEDNFMKLMASPYTELGQKVNVKNIPKDQLPRLKNKYQEHIFERLKAVEDFENIIKKNKGSEFPVIREDNALDFNVGDIYEPRRVLSFSAGDIGTGTFGKNRIKTIVPKEQSFLKTGDFTDFSASRNEREIVLPKDLKYEIVDKISDNELGGVDYLAKILNPYIVGGLIGGNTLINSKNQESYIYKNGGVRNINDNIGFLFNKKFGIQ